MNKYKNKLFESLPRQSTVDQLKRIREEIKKSQEIIIGPDHSKMSGDVGDRVMTDLKKHSMNNMFWWDNPTDRHIDSYETFVRDDSRGSLGYTKDGDPKTHKGTDYVKENIQNNKLIYNKKNNENMEKKLNNMLGFSDFEKSWKPKEQKATKHTEVGLDVINEGFFDNLFLKSNLKKALAKCDKQENYITKLIEDFVRTYKKDPESMLSKSYRKDINTYFKDHMKAGDYLTTIDKLRSYGFNADPNYVAPPKPSSSYRGSKSPNYTPSTTIGGNYSNSYNYPPSPSTSSSSSSSSFGSVAKYAGAGSAPSTSIGMPYLKDYADYQAYLDKCIKDNDYVTFGKVFNGFPKSWQEEYKKKRPTNIDIIDGSNLGIF